MEVPIRGDSAQINEAQANGKGKTKGSYMNKKVNDFVSNYLCF